MNPSFPSFGIGDKSKGDREKKNLGSCKPKKMSDAATEGVIKKVQNGSNSSFHFITHLAHLD